MKKEPRIPEPLTKWQREVLDTILHFVDTEKRFPSIREVADKLDMKESHSSIHRIFRVLEQKGYITRRMPHYALPDHRLDDLELEDDLEAHVYKYVVKKLTDPDNPKARPPDAMEIAERLELSLSGVYRALRNLEENGCLVSKLAYSQKVSLTMPDLDDVFAIRVFPTRIPLHDFYSSPANAENSIHLPLGFLIDDFREAYAYHLFALRLQDNQEVTGFSQGDLILFNRLRPPKSGELVAFAYQDRVFVRILVDQDGSEVHLSSEAHLDRKNERQQVNQSPDGVVLQQSEFRLLGVAVAAILRSLNSRT